MLSRSCIKTILNTAILNSFLICSTFSTIQLPFTSSNTLENALPNPFSYAKDFASLHAMQTFKAAAIVKASETLLKRVPFDNYVEDLADLQARVILKNNLAIVKKIQMINGTFENALSKKITTPYEALQCQSIIDRATNELSKLLHVSKIKMAETTTKHFLKTISSRFGILLAANILMQWHYGEKTSLLEQLTTSAGDVVLSEMLFTLLSLVSNKFHGINPWSNVLSYNRVASMLITMQPYLEDIIATFNEPDALSKEKAFLSLKYLLIGFYKNDQWYYNTSLFVANNYPQSAGFIIPNKYTVIETINCGPIAYSKAKEPQDTLMQPEGIIPAVITPLEPAPSVPNEIPSLVPGQTPITDVQITVIATPQQPTTAPREKESLYPHLTAISSAPVETTVVSTEMPLCKYDEEQSEEDSIEE